MINILSFWLKKRIITQKKRVPQRKSANMGRMNEMQPEKQQEKALPPEAKDAP